MVTNEVVNGETPAKRATIIEFWIFAAARCRDLNNFNAVTEIVCALRSSPVSRLKKSWGLVSKPVCLILLDFLSKIEWLDRKGSLLVGSKQHLKQHRS